MDANELYVELARSKYDSRPYNRLKNCGDGMEIIEEVIDGYWRERFLVNHNDKTAYELMTPGLKLAFVTKGDVDWDGVRTLENNENAYTFSARYPRFSVDKFQDGVAMVNWTLYPDGRFFMDEDGYGMEDNVESVIYGFIDTHARVVVPFQAIPRRELEKQRPEAVHRAKELNGETVEEPSQRVFNLVILDESGSMTPIARQAVGGVNETIQTIKAAGQKHENQHHFFTLVSFNTDHVRTIYDKVAIDKVEEFSAGQYRPSCCTPLYDAMGNALTNLRGYVADGDVVLVTIITDGYENASREYDGKSIKALVDELKKRNWVFTYIGANQDVEKFAATISVNNTLAWSSDVEGTQAMFARESECRLRFFDGLAEGDNDFSNNYFDNIND